MTAEFQPGVSGRADFRFSTAGRRSSRAYWAALRRASFLDFPSPVLCSTPSITAQKAKYSPCTFAGINQNVEARRGVICRQPREHATLWDKGYNLFLQTLPGVTVSFSSSWNLKACARLWIKDRAFISSCLYLSIRMAGSNIGVQPKRH